MLKPKKRKNGAVILSPRVCVAVGKKLIVQDGQWVSDGFSQYSSLGMCAEMRKMHGKKGRDRRSQMPKVIRTIGGWYMRFMKKNFPQAAASFEESSFVRTTPTPAGGEFPMRTGTAYASLTNRPDSKPTPPETERLLRSKRHSVRSEPNEHGVRLETSFVKYEEGGFGMFRHWVDDQGRHTNSKGELLNLPEIKGVQLKSAKNPQAVGRSLREALDETTMSSIIEEFGNQAEKTLIARIQEGKLDEETDRRVDEVTTIIVNRWLQKNYPASVDVELPHSGLTVKLQQPTQEDIENINLSDAYPKPGE